MPRGRKTKYFISVHPLTLEGELADKLTFVKEESRRLRSGKKQFIFINLVWRN